jgi:hypothetical protein
MNRRYIAGAGIVSALILAGMFVSVFVIPALPAFVSPAIAIDPVTERNLDGNNRLILTGKTTLPDKSFIVIHVDRLSRDPAQAPGVEGVDGYAQVIPGTDGKNLLKGIVDLSTLPPAEYTLTFVTRDYAENYSRIVESEALATSRFTLGDEGSGPGSIRKRTPVEEPFIRINTPGAGSPAAGREITGTTSLAPGTPLAWRVGETGTGSGGPEGVVQVVRGMEGVNRWSFVFNTTTFQPACCRVTVTALPGDNVSASAEFSLTGPGTAGSPAPVPGTSGFITIDSLPDMRSNGVYTITGTTSLPAGENLTFMVLPYSSGAEINFIIDPKDKAMTSRNPYSGTIGMAEVAKGGKRTNLWALALETYMMDPGMYEVKIDNDNVNFTTRAIIPGGLNASRVFTLED